MSGTSCLPHVLRCFLLSCLSWSSCFSIDCVYCNVCPVGPFRLPCTIEYYICTTDHYFVQCVFVLCYYNFLLLPHDVCRYVDEVATTETQPFFSCQDHKTRYELCVHSKNTYTSVFFQRECVTRFCTTPSFSQSTPSGP